ncbi:hypothetical protein [Priestia megaterium]|uniref:hypothetical protein n=1 Tax=Priestia megaterium TaxID=1404 RepID=UPI00211C5779|nr:hypothetical protein [Priestia megaterium]
MIKSKKELIEKYYNMDYKTGYTRKDCDKVVILDRDDIHVFGYHLLNNKTEFFKVSYTYLALDMKFIVNKKAFYESEFLEEKVLY